jgi:hypothetical protein
MSMMTVATFNERDKAEAVKGSLEQAGIRAEVYDESKLQKFWFWSKPHAGEKVRVDERDFEKARQILQGLDARDHVLEFAVRCPECGSSRIEYPQFTRKFITPTLVEIFCTTGLLDKAFYCEDCQYTWPVTPQPPPASWGGEQLDILGWKRKKETQ